MAIIVKMPKLGSTMKEGTVEKWHKNEGDMVEEEEILFEVTTEKLSNEIEADTEGVLRKILVEEGETVACQTPIAIIADADEDISELL